MALKQDRISQQFNIMNEMQDVYRLNVQRLEKLQVSKNFWIAQKSYLMSFLLLESLTQCLFSPSKTAFNKI